MPMYQYRCNWCHEETDTQVRADFVDCPSCKNLAKRIFGFAYKPPMQAHFNPSTNQYVSNESQFKDQLRQASDAATERTGIIHNFVPTDPRDMKAAGVTEEGLKETYDNATPPERKILDKYI